MKMKTIIIILVYIITIWGGSIIVENICRILKLPRSERQGLLNAGKYIGYLERFLILTFFILKVYEPIGLLFVGKSIIRFSEREESEYFLIGTLASFCWAILWGVIFYIAF